MSEHYEMVSSQESSTRDSMDNGGGLALTASGDDWARDFGDAN